MKFSTIAATVPFLLAVSFPADAACIYPQAPKSLPNGATATKDEMLAAQVEVKDYVKRVQEDYLGCLEKDRETAMASLDAADPDYEAKKANIETIHVKKHNAALEELQAYVDHWNAEKRAFEKAGK